MRKLMMIVMMTGLIAGCDEGTPSGENVPLNQVPEPVMKVAKDKLPGVSFEQAWKTPGGNYEVRGKAKNGKVRDIQVKANGEVVEVD